MLVFSSLVNLGLLKYKVFAEILIYRVYINNIQGVYFKYTGCILSVKKNTLLIDDLSISKV